VCAWEAGLGGNSLKQSQFGNKSFVFCVRHVVKMTLPRRGFGIKTKEFESETYQLLHNYVKFEQDCHECNYRNWKRKINVLASKSTPSNYSVYTIFHFSRIPGFPLGPSMPSVRVDGVLHHSTLEWFILVLDQECGPYVPSCRLPASSPERFCLPT
jgi:hypothetical protein